MPRARASAAAAAAASSDAETDYSDQSGAQRTQASKQKRGKGKQKKRSRADAGSAGDSDRSDGGEDEDEARGGRGKRRALLEEERQELVAAMTRHVLFTEHTRKVHTRSNMIAAVLTKPEHKGLFNHLIPLVQDQLRDVFGMELVPLRAKENQNKSAAKTYALRSTLPAELMRAAVTQTFADLSSAQDTGADLRKLKIFGTELADWHEDGDLLPTDRPGTAPVRDVKREEGAAYGILGVVLALCLVNGKSISDGESWRRPLRSSGRAQAYPLSMCFADQLVTYLRRLSLTPSTVIPLSISSTHRDNMTLAKYIDQLVQQGYLEKSASSTAAQTGKTSGRVPSTQRTQRASGVEAGDPGIEYRWGARSEVEFGELGIAHFIQYIYETGQNVQVVHEDEDQEDDGEQVGGQQQQEHHHQQAASRDRLIKEIARAAGVKRLQSAYEDEARQQSDDQGAMAED
ncbi:hypothetical protein OIV83_001140 [Microbotryomycetes sp. JL201]|nr:hypothetical protein OIV83_001140 [Microbotryomycetes sp. JL201]